MKQEFVMRGQTASGETEKLNFSGHKSGYAYKITEFSLYASTPSGGEALLGTITAGKTAVPPNDVDFRNQGLIATSMVHYNTTALDGHGDYSIINDTFMITQDLILKVTSLNSSEPVNWQCRFESVKMSGPQEAVTNYKQFMISDE